MSESTSPASNTKQRQRSPSFPSMTLEQAITKARALYDKDGKNAAPIAVIHGTWGYAANSGPANLAISSLKKYRLLQDEGSGAQRKARLTPTALEILHNPSPTKRAELIKEAALRPPIHRTLWEKYGGALPSNDTLRYHLVFERDFTESGARDFMSQFRRTIAYAQLTSADTLAGDSDSDLDGDDQTDPAGSGDEHGPEDQGYVPPKPREPQRRDANPRVGMTGQTQTIAVPMIGSPPVMIEGQFPLTEAAWDYFMTVLNAMKQGLVADGDDEAADPLAE